MDSSYPVAIYLKGFIIVNGYDIITEYIINYLYEKSSLCRVSWICMFIVFKSIICNGIGGAYPFGGSTWKIGMSYK